MSAMTAPMRGWERILTLREAGRAGVTRVGSKAATLGILLDSGFTVPEGMVLSCEVWDEVRRANDLPDDPTAEQVLAAGLPDDVCALLDVVLDSLGDGSLAVRSSAVAEDTADASFAGQYGSVLHVRGRDHLHQAVRRCWASAHEERVRRYDARGQGNAAIAVLVQRQVEAEVGGVAFTADPVTGSTDRVLVSATPGLGDPVTSGTARPDEWVVAATSVTPLRVRCQALTEAQAAAVAALALRVEATLGSGPQDVEWAMAEGRVVLLQSRPITALPRRPVVDLPPGTWVKEVDRHPEPLTALGASLVAPLVTQGLSTMLAEYGGLLARMEVRSLGGEPYLRAVPPGGREGTPPPWWVLGVLVRVVPGLRRRMQAARAAMRPGVLEGLVDRWYTQWRPELRAETDRLRAVDRGALDDRRLADHLGDIRALADRAMAVHFRLIPPYLVPVHTLVQTCARLLGWPEARCLELLTGTSHATSAPVRELAALAGEVRSHPQARAATQSAGVGTGERLQAVAPELGGRYAAWCEQYGYRNVNDDPGSPLLVELPATLARLLRDAVEKPPRPAAGADDALSEARSSLATGPTADRDAFERALEPARRAYPLREDVAFWTGSAVGCCLRLAALEVGRRLVARGVLARPDDVVHLRVEMLGPALLDTDRAVIAEEVRRARAERAWVRRHPGPPFHGPEPGPPPDLRGLPPEARRLTEAMLWMQRRPSAPRPGGLDATLGGVAAGPGRYTGPVRLITGVADFARLERGDVLVCAVTDPAWTVLFGTAGALVTDGGGVLSHAAIVAREFGIPAVVGTGQATSTLREGQVVTVDGNNGTVLAANAHPADEGDRR